MRRGLVISTCLAATVLSVVASAVAQGQTPAAADVAPTVAVTLGEAQRHFYNGSYDLAAEAAQSLAVANPDDLAAVELRTSALLFKLKRLFGEPQDKDKAFKQCSACPALASAIVDEVTRGRTRAKAHLEAQPDDQTTRFFLGKLDLDYVWLQLGVLGRRTGWDEYWEARHSLDAVLKQEPRHTRARVARAWIDYIVDTRMPFGFRWILGGGNKKAGLKAVRESTDEASEFYDRAEARFGLWDMLVREKNFSEAALVARTLLNDFPMNTELTRFVAVHGGATR